MYHRLLKIFIASQDPHLKPLLQSVEPLEQFSHQIICRSDVEGAELAGCKIIILDSLTDQTDKIRRIHAAKDPDSLLIACFTAENLTALAEVHDLLDQLWVKPFAEQKVLASFARILTRIKEREDATLTQKYLDTLIDNLPDLIWFKDARGAHLKVNKSFCQTVNKTKEQVEGRGHYYIWDIEPDEYAKGEYVCLESEEIVLNKKETCLFDETVKCQNELRKFKTYKSPIFDTDGGVIGTVGYAHDVTDLQNLLIEVNILLESLPFAAMVTDKNNNITTVNQKFIDLFLVQRSELIGKNIEYFIDESRTFTNSRRWNIEEGQEGILLLSENKVLKVQDEQLLDIFGALVGYLYLYFDITLEYELKNQLIFDANTDHLTKLNNRRSLQDFMRKTSCQPGTALLLADLDNFKQVNDQFGHDKGDRILVAFSSLLQQLFPAENLFRLGGDEFAIIIPKPEDAELAENFAERLLEGFEAMVAQQFPQTKISVSIGIAKYVDSMEHFGELFKKADIALYDSKNSGKSAYTLWNVSKT